MKLNMEKIAIGVFISMIYILGLSAQTSGDRCSIANVEAAKHECHDVYAGGHHGDFDTICDNVECYLQCLKEAIGGCYSDPHNFKEDIEVYKALFRVRCLNATLTRLAEENCDYTVPCVDETFNKEQIDIMMKATNLSSALQTKQIECKLSARSVSCISVQQDANCTSEMAELQTTIATLKHSLSQCNISQENVLFQKYGGEIICQKPINTCFTSSLTSRMLKCQPVTMATFMQPNKSAIQEICQNIECTSKCYKQAIGECHKENKFIMLDPEAIKIYTRATCDNIDVFASTIRHCRMQDTSCLRTLAQSMLTAQMHIHSEKFSEYKNLVCGATSQFRSCISFDVNENCTESMAVLAKNLYEVWHSYSACGEVNNMMFKQYAGDLTCESGEHSEESMSSANLQTLSLLISLLLAVTHFLFQL